MILQIYLAILGIAAVSVGVDNAVKGFKANEEEYLQANLDGEKWIEEEKKSQKGNRSY